MSSRNRCKGEKAHVCLETDEFSYTDQDVFLKGLAPR